MVNLINLENVDKTYGLKTLLNQVSLGVNTGDRVGVVGLNGGGKSTLLRILAQTDTPDAGRVSHNNDLRMAMVSQDVLREVLVDDSKATMTVADAVLKPLGLEVYEWAGDPKVRAVLNGLGVADLGLDTRVRDLSGGQRRRTGLAAALVQELDLLILDEPTNHLDVEGVQWLADHLLGRNTSLVVVTHDRWFLDTVANTTWEVHDGVVDVYEGGYNDWTFARAERARQADAAEQRRQNLARKELAWLRRGAPARTSKPRYRIEAAEALIADVPPMRDSVELMAFSARRQGKKVIELEDATLSTPDGRVLVHDLTWRLGPGERIGLVGVNGSGKTTLLRALAGEKPLDTGKRIEGRTVRVGWLRQELDDLDPTRRLLDAVQDVASYVQFGDKELSASQLAERLGFSAKRQRTPVGDLSGGERRRLQLTRILMAEPNVLLLDEPTNDLDIDTLQELESLLDGWPGTMVVISHDRYLIERICDSTWALFGDGKLTNLPGGIEQYLNKRAELQAAAGRNDNVLIFKGAGGGGAGGSVGAGGVAGAGGGAGGGAAGGVGAGGAFGGGKVAGTGGVGTGGVGTGGAFAGASGVAGAGGVGTGDVGAGGTVGASAGGCAGGVAGTGNIHGDEHHSGKGFGGREAGVGQKRTNGQHDNGLSSQEERQLRKEMNAIERKMGKVEQRIQDIHARMTEAAEAASAGNVDTELLTSLDKELQAANAEHEELEIQWLELGEKLEG